MEEENLHLPTPWWFGGKKVPHYHGDSVRLLFLVSAILFIIVIPIWGSILPIGQTQEILAILALVLLAGLTNPHSRLLIVIDIAVAGFGALLLEVAAIDAYQEGSIALFMTRELGAVLLLLAFYYAAKTLRAMMLGKVGREGNEQEFTFHR